MNEELLREQQCRACCTSELFLNSWDKENSTSIGLGLDLEFAHGKENLCIMPIWYSSCFLLSFSTITHTQKLFGN